MTEGNFQPYPLFFHPIFQYRIWGGEKLKTLFNKSIPDNRTGESWELSGLKEAPSVVSNGVYSGKNINELLEHFGVEVLGESVVEKYGNQLPLLFKLLDAREQLSIQVHPNDELAQQRHNSFGKTEMWYVVQADSGSELIAGFEKNTSVSEFKAAIETSTVTQLMRHHEVQQGDTFFLETGTVHAIGAGIVIAEIQQTSDITYRIYDFDRIDQDGKKRQLHIEESLDAINFKANNPKVDKSAKAANILVECPYFNTYEVHLKAGANYVVEKRGVFSAFMLVSGAIDIYYADSVIAVSAGQTFLLPAAINDQIIFKGAGTFLEVFVGS